MFSYKPSYPAVVRSCQRARGCSRASSCASSPRGTTVALHVTRSRGLQLSRTSERKSVREVRRVSVERFGTPPVDTRKDGNTCSHGRTTTPPTGFRGNRTNPAAIDVAKRDIPTRRAPEVAGRDPRPTVPLIVIGGGRARAADKIIAGATIEAVVGTVSRRETERAHIHSAAVICNRDCSASRTRRCCRSMMYSTTRATSNRQPSVAFSQSATTGSASRCVKTYGTTRRSGANASTRTTRQTTSSRWARTCSSQSTPRRSTKERWDSGARWCRTARRRRGCHRVRQPRRRQRRHHLRRCEPRLQMVTANNFTSAAVRGIFRHGCLDWAARRKVSARRDIGTVLRRSCSASGITRRKSFHDGGHRPFGRHRFGGRSDARVRGARLRERPRS